MSTESGATPATAAPDPQQRNGDVYGAAVKWREL